MQHSTLAKRAWLLLALTVVAVYLYGLGGFALLGPDEPRYAQVAREMFARGDWVTPTLGGHTWFEKPALLYWLMLANFTLFGVTEFAARLGSALCGILTVVSTAYAAWSVERAEGERARWFAITSAAVTATCAGLLVFSRGASFDIVLTMTTAAAISLFFVSELETDLRRRRLLLVTAYAFVGFSLLAKGLVGIVIPAGVVGLYYLLRREWPDIRRAGLWWGALVSLAVAALWYVPVIARHGQTFIDEFFVQHHFARYVSNKYHHPQPFYFYLPIVALLALPWTVFLGEGLAAFRRQDWRAADALSRARILSLAWLILPVAFFSVSGSKLPGYVLPALPGAALLAGERVMRYMRGTGGTLSMRLTGGLSLALGLAGIVYAFRTREVATACVVAVALPALAFGILALLFAARRAACVLGLVAVTFLTLVLIVGCAVEKFAERQTVRGLLERAEARGLNALPVYQLHIIERTSEFYAAGRLAYDPAGEPLKFEGTFQVVDAARRNGGRALVLVPLEYLAQLLDDPRMEKELIGDNGETALVLVSAK